MMTDKEICGCCEKTTARTEEELIRMLDGFAESDTGRLKVLMDDNLTEGLVQKQYHHGRCDVCSPWATGQPIGAEIEPEE